MEVIGMLVLSAFNISAAMLLAPLMIGVINRTKAVLAGRRGRPLLQGYYDLAKLVRKGAVYSRTTTWVFRAGPVVGLAATVVALMLLPSGGAPGLMPFSGDFVLFAYLMGLGRFFTVAAAMDTGSAFEGMGASREATFSALVEPVLFIGLITLVRLSGGLSLSGLAHVMPGGSIAHTAPALALVAASFFILTLTENSRIPVDDPNTHLELTMIHEVMVLDHSGPDLAFILYGASLKLWAFCALIAGLTVPFLGFGVAGSLAAFVAGIFVIAVLIGIVESAMARLGMFRVPQFIAVAAALSASALALSL
jgi:formate hydrogenlyase subunit 4